MAIAFAIPSAVHSANFYTLQADLKLQGFSFYGWGFGMPDADPAARQYLLDTGNCSVAPSDPDDFSCQGRFNFPLNSQFVDFDNTARGWLETLSVTIEIDTRLFGQSGRFDDLAIPNFHFECSGSSRVCGSLLGLGSYSFSASGYSSEVFGGDSHEIANLGANGSYTYLYDHWAPTISGLGFFNAIGGGDAYYAVTSFSMAPPIVPLGATAPLLLTSIGGLFLFQRRRRAS